MAASCTYKPNHHLAGVDESDTKKKPVTYGVDESDTKEKPVTYGVDESDTKKKPVTYGVDESDTKKKTVTYGVDESDTKKSLSLKENYWRIFSKSPENGSLAGKEQDLVAAAQERRQKSGIRWRPWESTWRKTPDIPWPPPIWVQKLENQGNWWLV